jgi:hypothetical protein
MAQGLGMKMCSQVSSAKRSVIPEMKSVTARSSGSPDRGATP